MTYFSLLVEQYQQIIGERVILHIRHIIHACVYTYIYKVKK